MVNIRWDSAGRIQPTAYRNLLQPGQCALCNRIGRTPDETFANLGVELEFYGILYLCVDCCTEVADFVGFVSPERTDKLTLELDALQEHLVKARRELNYMKGLLDARIDLAGDGEPVLNVPDGVSLLEDEQPADEISRILNGN